MQLQLPMLTVYEGPKLVLNDIVNKCKTYREAVQACYQLRTRPRMPNLLLAAEVGCNASHIGDYITHGKRKTKRDLPAEYITAFEVACGNRLITQWLTSRANLTVLETFIQARAA